MTGKPPHLTLVSGGTEEPRKRGKKAARSSKPIPVPPVTGNYGPETIQQKYLSLSYPAQCFVSGFMAGLLWKGPYR